MVTKVDGASYPESLITIITRPSIPQSVASISGTSTFCSGSTNYTPSSNVNSGENVSWSISDTSIATLSSPSNSGVTLNKVGNGEITLTATISNACGQSYTKTKTIFVGAPPSFNVARGLAQDEFCDIKYHYVPFTITNKSPLLNYSVSVFGLNTATVSSYTNDGFILRFLKTYSGWAEFTVNASNACGSVGKFREAYIDDCTTIPYGSQQRIAKPVSVFKVFPNPSSDMVYVSLANTNNAPKRNQNIKATLYDMLGYEKKKVKINNNEASIDVSDLKSGLYILRVIINSETETHLISVK